MEAYREEVSDNRIQGMAPLQAAIDQRPFKKEKGQNHLIKRSSYASEATVLFSLELTISKISLTGFKGLTNVEYNHHQQQRVSN